MIRGSVVSKVLKLLQKGKTITPAQIAKRYKVANPHQPVYLLEQYGISVKRSYTKGTRGFPTVTYSM